MNGSVLCSLAAGPVAVLAAAPVYSSNRPHVTSVMPPANDRQKQPIDFTGRFHTANVGGTRFPLRSISAFDVKVRPLFAKSTP
jgi:hypothetical protein